MKTNKSIFLILLLSILIFNNCNNTNLEPAILEGYVLDDKTELPLEGVTTFLVRTGWEDYNNTIEQETKTDENGYYKFIVEDGSVLYAGWNYGVGLPAMVTTISYLTTYGRINVDGNEYDYAQSPMGVKIYREFGQDMTFRLRPTAYFKLHFKNINPFDENDMLEFNPTDEPWLKLQGMNVDTTVITRRFTQECKSINWYIKKDYYNSNISGEYCCPDGDTCLVEAFY